MKPDKSLNDRHGNGMALAELRRSLSHADLACPGLDLYGHSTRVGELATGLGCAMGLCERDARLLGEAACFHDVGKLFIPVSTLGKPGPLAFDERSLIESHCDLGYNALANETGAFAEMARNIARLHHERCDGKGYPGRLGGTDIPFEARIVAVADVYDALRSVRSYKAQRSHEDTVGQIVKECRGDPGGFDPLVMEAFLDNQADFCAIWDRAMLSRLAATMKGRRERTG